MSIPSLIPLVDRAWLIIRSSSMVLVYASSTPVSSNKPTKSESNHQLQPRLRVMKRGTRRLQTFLQSERPSSSSA